MQNAIKPHLQEMKTKTRQRSINKTNKVPISTALKENCCFLRFWLPSKWFLIVLPIKINDLYHMDFKTKLNKEGIWFYKRANLVKNQ